MRALVTGAAGFVGARLAQRLKERDHTVTGLDLFTDYYDPNLKRRAAAWLAQQGVPVIEGDLNTVPLDELLDVDVVFHLAGQPGVRKSWGSDFGSYVSANISATQRLLEAVTASERRPKVVYASSSSVYGSAESFPTTEDTLPRPRSPYGVSKLAAEHLCSLYAENFGVDTVSLRYFTVYGPRQRPDMAFTRFISAALSGTTIQVYGDGEQIRDFTFVDDIVEANIAAAASSTKPGSVFNASGGSDISVNDTLAIIGHFVGQELDVRYLDAVDGDVRRTGGDSSPLRSATGWSPRVDIRTGLEAQVEWLRVSTPGGLG